MNKGVFGLVGFVLGAAAGSLTAWKLLEKKYAKIADEEVESVKRAYSQKYHDPKKSCGDTRVESPEVTMELTKDEEVKLNNIAARYISDDARPDYSAYSATKDTDKDIPEDKPYVISPQEFDEIEGYETIELTYHQSNGVLTDDAGDPIDDPVDIVGDDFASHFGEYEDDCVFVRNDRHKCDYQILLDSEGY